MKTLSQLIEAAQQISEYAAQYHKKTYSVGAKAWKFERSAMLAGVSAMVCDDNGGPIDDPDHKLEGQPRLQLDIEYFPERARTYTYEGQEEIRQEQAAGSDVIRFAESLGFKAESVGSGSGQYGHIECYLLT